MCNRKLGCALAAAMLLLTSTAQAAEEKAPAAKAQSPFRYTSYSDAWNASKKSNKPILIYVSMNHCPHCEQMLDETFGQKDIQQMVSESFESVAVDRTRDAKLVEKLKVKWFPTTILVGVNHKVIAKVEGFIEPGRFRQQIKTNLAKAGGNTAKR